MYRVNLLPPDLLPGPHVDRRRLALVAAVTLTLGLVVVFGAVWVSRFVMARQELAWTRAELAALQETVTRAREVINERHSLEEATEVLNGLKAGVRPYKPLLDRIGEKMPVDLWFTSIEICYDEKRAEKKGEARQPGNMPPSRADESNNPLAEGDVAGAALPPVPDTILIKGRSRSVPSIGVLARHLSGNPALAAVSLGEIQERKEDQNFSFVITCRLAGTEGGAPVVVPSE
ncbi:MAG: PilN domain-containing protein [Bacillota bacterium]|nr:PilN domain-containing protein [Bacillota bacterium]